MSDKTSIRVLTRLIYDDIKALAKEFDNADVTNMYTTLYTILKPAITESTASTVGSADIQIEDPATASEVNDRMSRLNLARVRLEAVVSALDANSFDSQAFEYRKHLEMINNLIEEWV